ncbi:glycoside hydrolase family 5 protein [Homoserinibacter sp. GY 40078]|uniref:glycoside hydrolase family 5 protein n=1 Tax=Homoserinibacter sp. GY 40078 TaxID=2603275 RepID=UPI002106C0CD|nr:cellulase family glycosylhydrolase [Homoserinibacter sp. GY 40078]
MPAAHAASAFSPRPANLDGFVRARGAAFVDAAGNELLLRGVGLGNWLLPEGYMWRFGPGAESPREIEALVDRLVGRERAEAFWSRFQDAFVSEADIALIAASGFDHVRVPINARVVQRDDGSMIEEGLALIDRLIGWCRDHRLWVLLDLHGAPGGQTGTNIDDSLGRPELFLDERYRRNTLRLWRALAERYAHDTTVLGYDLLNEPLPNEWQHRFGDELAELYRDLTREIRAVDPDHLLMYEGSHWATNWSIFTEVWDDNSALQFHKYWSAPDRASIAPFLEARDRLGLPIYMGEGGENTLEWLYTAFRLYESEGIGWNFWPWKKIDTRTSPASIVPPAGWDRMIQATGGGDVPDAGRILDDLLDAMRIENCRWQPEIVAALTGVAPVVVPAWGFGFRGAGESFEVADGAALAGIREDEAAGIRFALPGGNPANPFEQTDGRAYAPAERLVVDLAPGDWLEFEGERFGDVAAVRAIDAAGGAAEVRIVPSPRGIRVVAERAVTLERLELGARGG